MYRDVNYAFQKRSLINSYSTVNAHDSESISVFSTLSEVTGGLVRSRRVPRKRTDVGRIAATLDRVIRGFGRDVNTLWRAEWSIFKHIMRSNGTFILSRPPTRPGEAPGACAVSCGLVLVIPAPQKSSYDPVNGRCEHLPLPPPEWSKMVVLGGMVLRT